MDIKKVAMIGAGIMGNQIAMQVAISGYEVCCYSRSAETLEKAELFSKKWFAKQIAKEKMSQEAADLAQGKLAFTNDLKEAVEDSELIIEAVADIVDVKKDMLSQIDAWAPEHAIYASNSSYIVSSRFCDAVRHPENVINLHFFNPALVMPIVEVVRGPHTSDQAVEIVYKFAESINKTPVLVEKEIYGFIVNRIFSALTREACYLVDQGVATVEDIDKAVKGGLNHPMGPLELLDMTGIDLEYNVYMEKFRMTGELTDRPAACLTERYAKGEYGRKTGKGFYEYNK